MLSLDVLTNWTKNDISWEKKELKYEKVQFLSTVPHQHLIKMEIYPLKEWVNWLKINVGGEQVPLSQKVGCGKNTLQQINLWEKESMCVINAYKNIKHT